MEVEGILPFLVVLIGDLTFLLSAAKVLSGNVRGLDLQLQPLPASDFLCPVVGWAGLQIKGRVIDFLDMNEGNSESNGLSWVDLPRPTHVTEQRCKRKAKQGWRRLEVDLDVSCKNLSIEL